MKLNKTLLFTLVIPSLSGCFAVNNLRDLTFDPHTLPDSAYKGYWAMSDGQGVNNTIKFNQDGTARLYRFECISPTQYKEKAHEDYRMESVRPQVVNLYHVQTTGESITGALASLLLDHTTIRFNGTTKNGEMAMMTQEIPGKVHKMTYARLPSPKPLCTNPKLEKKVHQRNMG